MLGEACVFAVHADIYTLVLARRLNTDWKNGVGAQSTVADCTSVVLKKKNGLKIAL